MLIMFGFETTATRIVCAPPFEDEPALLDDEEPPHPASVTTTAPSPTAPVRSRSMPRPGTSDV
jgi:hypothetical protein